MLQKLLEFIRSLWQSVKLLNARNDEGDAMQYSAKTGQCMSEHASMKGIRQQLTSPERRESSSCMLIDRFGEVLDASAHQAIRKSRHDIRPSQCLVLHHPGC